MNCVMCRGDLKEQKINYPVDLTHQFLLIKDVPAQVCQQCGEYYLADEIYAKIEEIIKTAQKSSIEIEILKFAA